MFPPDKANISICFSDVGSRSGYVVLAVDGLADLHFGASVDAYQQVPLRVFNDDGESRDNVTDWALDQFKKQYRARRGQTGREISKEDIFNYVYGVLYDPIYREKYALNLKREFPRIPFYPDFWQWAQWGSELMKLHVGYETVQPWALERTDVPDANGRRLGIAPRTLLRADRVAGRVSIDTETTLAGIPADAWEYQLGNRSAIECVLARGWS
jgi:predicted helicase